MMNSSNVVTAMVTAVDLKRGVCKCLTANGRSLREVRWRNNSGGRGAYGDNEHPQELDPVYLEEVDRQYYIIGHMVAPFYSSYKYLPYMRQQDVEVRDVSDYSFNSYEKMIFGPSRPGDSKVGDRVFTSESGGMFGMRRQGTFFARVTATCQFIMSRFGDMARLISRNFEQFTDMDSLYKVSGRGSLYSLRQVFRSTEDSRIERTSFEEIHGNVSHADALGIEYSTLPKADFESAVGGAIAEDADVTRRTRTFDTADTMTSMESEDIHGATHRIIRDKDDIMVQETLTDKVENWAEIQDSTDFHSRHHQDARNIDEDASDEASTKYYTRRANAGRVHETLDDQGGSHKAESYTDGSRHWVRIHNGDGSYFELTEHLVHLDVAGNIRLDIDKDKAVIDAGGGSTVTIHKGGQVTVDCDTATVNAGTSVTLNTPMTTMTGDVRINKTLTVDQQTSLKANLNVTGFSQLSGGVNVG